MPKSGDFSLEQLREIAAHAGRTVEQSESTRDEGIRRRRREALFRIQRNMREVSSLLAEVGELLVLNAMDVDQLVADPAIRNMIRGAQETASSQVAYADRQSKQRGFGAL